MSTQWCPPFMVTAAISMSWAPRLILTASRSSAAGEIVIFAIKILAAALLASASGVVLRQVLEPVPSRLKKDRLASGGALERDLELCIGTYLDRGDGGGPKDKDTRYRDE